MRDKIIWKILAILIGGILLVLMPITACAQSTSDKANEHKILLDTDIEVIDTVSYAGATYHVVKYNNILPYARGIEIISSDGSLILDSGIAKSVLTQIAWEDAAAQLNASDIDTLKEILETAKKINNTVPSVTPEISIVSDKIEELKEVKFTRAIMVNEYPEILTLRSDLKSLKTDLKEWNSSIKIIDVLPEVIQGLEDVRAGKEMNPRLANDIQESASAFGILKAETDDIDNKLSDTISRLSDAESAMRLTKTRTFREHISALADCLRDLNNKAKPLREDAQSFSSSLSEATLKLPVVVNVANEKTKDLYDSWNSRRGASALIYLTLGGIVAIGVAPLILAGVLIYRKRKEGEGGADKEKKKGEGEK